MGFVTGVEELEDWLLCGLELLVVVLLLCGLLEEVLLLCGLLEEVLLLCGLLEEVLLLCGLELPEELLEEEPEEGLFELSEAVEELFDELASSGLSEEPDVSEFSSGLLSDTDVPELSDELHEDVELELPSVLELLDLSELPELLTVLELLSFGVSSFSLLSLHAVSVRIAAHKITANVFFIAFLSFLVLGSFFSCRKNSA